VSFDYTKSAASSLRMLTRFGQDITRTSYTAGTYDPATGSATPTTATTTRKGVLLPLSDNRAGQQYIRGTLIATGDKQLLLDASGPVAITDHYTVNGAEYTVVSIDDLNPAGTAVLNDLHVRLA
jgi:hypothetical protein